MARINVVWNINAADKQKSIVFPVRYETIVNVD